MRFGAGLGLGIVIGVLLGFVVASYLPIPTHVTNVTAATHGVKWGEEGAYAIYAVSGHALFIPVTGGEVLIYCHNGKYYIRTSMLGEVKVGTSDRLDFKEVLKYLGISPTEVVKEGEMKIPTKWGIRNAIVFKAKDPTKGYIMEIAIDKETGIILYITAHSIKKEMGGAALSIELKETNTLP